MTFHGIFEHTLDAKHRLTMPAKYRTEFADGVLLALTAEIEPGDPRTITIWKPEAYAQHTAAIFAGLNPATPKARKLQRLYFGFSERTELDAAYRVMIPATLMAYAGLNREVTITGLGHCLEIWDRARFRDSFDAIITEAPQLNASLGDTT